MGGMTPMNQMNNMYGMNMINNNNMNPMMGKSKSANNFNGWDLSELQNMNSFFDKYGLKDEVGNYNVNKIAQMYGPNVKLFQTLDEQALQDPSLV